MYTLRACDTRTCHISNSVSAGLYPQLKIHIFMIWKMVRNMKIKVNKYYCEDKPKEKNCVYVSITCP